MAAGEYVCRQSFPAGNCDFSYGPHVPDRPGLVSDGDGAAERAEGRHLPVDGDHRDRLAAVSVHDELADDAAGQGALRQDSDVASGFPEGWI